MPEQTPALSLEQIEHITRRLRETAVRYSIDWLNGETFDAWLAGVRERARWDAMREARGVISQYLSTAEKWRYDRVVWAFGIMTGEIPEDTPCPQAPSRACTCYGGPHGGYTCPSCEGM